MNGLVVLSKVALPPAPAANAMSSTATRPARSLARGSLRGVPNAICGNAMDAAQHAGTAAAKQGRFSDQPEVHPPEAQSPQAQAWPRRRPPPARDPVRHL